MQPQRLVARPLCRGLHENILIVRSELDGREPLPERADGRRGHALVTTPGPYGNLGDIVRFDGFPAEDKVILFAAVDGTIVCPIIDLQGGTLSFKAFHVYAWDSDAKAWGASFRQFTPFATNHSSVWI